MSGHQYRIEITPAAARELRKMVPDVRQRIVAAIDALGLEPRPDGVRKLVGADKLYRIREGNYRIVYEIHDQVLVIVVVRVRHRREAYK